MFGPIKSIPAVSWKSLLKGLSIVAYVTGATNRNRNVMMEEINTMLLHLLAGLKCGPTATCGEKVQHSNEILAEKHAERLNKSKKSKHKVETYPCPFCYCWHVGREFSLSELQRLARR